MRIFDILTKNVRFLLHASVLENEEDTYWHKIWQRGKNDHSCWHITTLFKGGAWEIFGNRTLAPKDKVRGLCSTTFDLLVSTLNRCWLLYCSAPMEALFCSCFFIYEILYVFSCLVSQVTNIFTPNRKYWEKTKVDDLNTKTLILSNFINWKVDILF